MKFVLMKYLILVLLFAVFSVSAQARKSDAPVVAGKIEQGYKAKDDRNVYLMLKPFVRRPGSYLATFINSSSKKVQVFRLEPWVKKHSYALMKLGRALDGQYGMVSEIPFSIMTLEIDEDEPRKSPILESSVAVFGQTKFKKDGKYRLADYKAFSFDVKGGSRKADGRINLFDYEEWEGAGTLKNHPLITTADGSFEIQMSSVNGAYVTISSDTVGWGIERNSTPDNVLVFFKRGKSKRAALVNLDSNQCAWLEAN